MFRARNHEGVAAECLFELFAGGRKMNSDQRMRAFAGAAVIAGKVLRGHGGQGQ